LFGVGNGDLFILRLFSVQAYRENDRIEKVVVPIIWVNDFLGVFFWPPKGKKTVGHYVGMWAKPDLDWIEYDIEETILNTGTKEECDQMLQFDTTQDELDNKSEVEEAIEDYHVSSPIINSKALLRKQRTNFSSDEEEHVSHHSDSPSSEPPASHHSKTSLKNTSPEMSPLNSPVQPMLCSDENVDINIDTNPDRICLNLSLSKSPRKRPASQNFQSSQSNRKQPSTLGCKSTTHKSYTQSATPNSSSTNPQQPYSSSTSSRKSAKSNLSNTNHRQPYSSSTSSRKSATSNLSSPNSQQPYSSSTSDPNSATPKSSSTNPQQPYCSSSTSSRKSATPNSSSTNPQQPYSSSTSSRKSATPNSLSTNPQQPYGSSSISSRKSTTPKSYAPSASSSTSRSAIPRYSDGGASFREMPNKQFQYTVLMELAKISNFKNEFKEELHLLQLNQHNDNDDGTDNYLEPIASMDEFNREERKLEGQADRRKKRSNIKSIGGKDPRSIVRNALDSLMTREVQCLFSKDGLTGKRAFARTALYKCLVGALIDSSEKSILSKNVIDFYIGDLLKRAGRTKHVVAALQTE